MTSNIKTLREIGIRRNFTDKENRRQVYRTEIGNVYMEW